MSTSPPSETIVVKVGGSVLELDAFSFGLADDVSTLVKAGARVVIVHGGGPQVDRHMSSLGIESTFVGGLRHTTTDDLSIVRMVLTGQVQRELATAIDRAGIRAVGVSGEDAGLLRAKHRDSLVDGTAVDLGMVGDVDHVDPSLLVTLLEAGHVPVVSTIATSAEGLTYNVNADSAAGAIASAIGADLFVILSDIPGLLIDWPNSEEIVDLVGADALAELLPALRGGIAPKMEACLRAVRSGVRCARVVDGREQHALVRATIEGDSRHDLGTTVVAV